jgi:DNA-3-methyladenine glycosylase I
MTSARSDDVVVGEDGVARCRWGASPAEYARYHDEEWGRPVADEARVFENLSLDGFQSGLSWLTILRKREGFRRAFQGFDPVVVAEFGTDDVARLLGDATIVRNRAKILATITNARATVRLHREGLSLAALIWAYAPRTSLSTPRRLADLPAVTAESTALAAELRRRGYAFVGPTTVYAAMQALGLVNDHLAGCAVRTEAGEERTRFVVPR